MALTPECEISAGRDGLVEIRGFASTIEAALIWRSPKLPFRGAVSVWVAAASVYSATWPAEFASLLEWRYPDGTPTEEEFLGLVAEPMSRVCAGYAPQRGGGLIWEAPLVLLSPPRYPQDGGLWHVEIFCVAEDRQDALFAHEAAQRRLHVVQSLLEAP